MSITCDAQGDVCTVYVCPVYDAVVLTIHTTTCHGNHSETCDGNGVVYPLTVRTVMGFK